MRHSFTLVLVAFLASPLFASTPTIPLLRVPDGGLQPQAVVDGKGTLHLLYFKGDPSHGDLFYVHSSDGGDAFSAPIRVNSQPESVIAIGTIRGAHLCLGKTTARTSRGWGPNPPSPEHPAMNFRCRTSRSNDAWTGFEPQRNVITLHPGLDGGGRGGGGWAGGCVRRLACPDRAKDRRSQSPRVDRQIHR